MELTHEGAGPPAFTPSTGRDFVGLNSGTLGHSPGISYSSDDRCRSPLEHPPSWTTGFCQKPIIVISTRPTRQTAAKTLLRAFLSRHLAFTLTRPPYIPLRIATFTPPYPPM